MLNFLKLMTIPNILIAFMKIWKSDLSVFKDSYIENIKEYFINYFFVFLNLWFRKKKIINNNDKNL